MKKLMRLVEVEKGSVELKKGTSDSEIKKYTDKGIDVQLVDPNTEKLEEAKRQYTTQESAAVGKAVAKSLVKVLRGQGDEVVNIKLTGVGVNRFNIHVTYGNDKGQDTFKFKLNPQSEDIHIETEQGDESLTDFLITQGNTVSLPTPELESKLAEVMKKYVSEPSDEEYDDMAAMQAPVDPSQLNKNIAEKLGPKSKPETYIKDFQKSKAPQFKGKSDEKKRQMAIAAYMANKNEGVGSVEKEIPLILSKEEDFDRVKRILRTDPQFGDLIFTYWERSQPLGSIRGNLITMYFANTKNEVADFIKAHGIKIANTTFFDLTETIYKNMKEDLDIGHQDDEPAMLKKDVYRIAKMAAMLYKQLEAYEGTQEVDFPHWWQAKIIKAYDYLQSAYGYLDAEQNTNNMDTTVVTTMALQEKKGTCCHKCGHVHVKGESHPTPYLTGKKNCKFRD